MRRALIAVTAATALLALLPAGASAVKLTYGQYSPMTLDLTDDDGVENEIGLTKVEVVEGHPDVVVGDLKAGIPDPIPSECARVDATVVRCPAGIIVGVVAVLGGGNDTLGISEDFGYRSANRFSAATAAFNPFVRVQFGAGADQASDLSPYRDIWNGGPGRDRLASGPGNDKVKGGAQNDVIDCGKGKH
jgi:Ca2+-binding RTX toxin-like protein